METLKYICKIIQDNLELDDQHIYIFNQKYIMPTDKGLFVAVGIEGEQVINQGSDYKMDGGNYTQEQSLIKQGTLSIDVYSYDFSAIDKKDDVILALNSDMSQNMQDKYSFHIGTTPLSINDVSEQDGTKIINRFNITFNIIYGKSKSNKSDYYNSSDFLIYKND